MQLSLDGHRSHQAQPACSCLRVSAPLSCSSSNNNSYCTSSSHISSPHQLILQERSLLHPPMLQLLAMLLYLQLVTVLLH